MKKILALAMVVLLMVMGIGAVVSAATGVSNVMRELKKTAAPPRYLPQVESYLVSRNITDQQARDLITHIRKADKIAGKTTAFSKLSPSQQEGIYNEIVACGKILGLKVTYDVKTLRTYDSSNKLVFEISDADMIKQTGHDYSQLLIGLAVMLLAAGTAVFTYRRRSLSSPV